MSTEEPTTEARVLSMMKRVLTDIAKDTYTPPNMKHPLTPNTIQGIRDCLGVISSRETELAEQAGKTLNARPRFVDEPQSSVVVPLDIAAMKKGTGKDQAD